MRPPITRMRRTRPRSTEAEKAEQIKVALTGHLL